MKKVLIINNSIINAENAKKFFSKIPGYNFLYTDNRIDAEAVLPSIDILITDANIQYGKNDSLEDYPEYQAKTNASIGEEFEPLTNEEALAAATGINGWSLLLKAKIKRVPNIMIGTYGTFKKADMLKLNDSASLPHAKLIKLIEGDNRKNWKEFSEQLDHYWSLNHRYINWCQYWREESVAELTDWAVVWEQVQKQLKSSA